MFSFFEKNYIVIESGVEYEKMQEKYADKLMVVMNTYLNDGLIHGDIVALLTPAEYEVMDKPKSFAPKFRIWEGNKIADEGVNSLYGIYL